MRRRREEFSRDRSATSQQPVFNVRTGKYEVVDDEAMRNASGVEETINRIWENDPTLTEVCAAFIKLTNLLTCF